MRLAARSRNYMVLLGAILKNSENELLIYSWTHDYIIIYQLTICPISDAFSYRTVRRGLSYSVRARGVVSAISFIKIIRPLIDGCKPFDHPRSTSYSILTPRCRSGRVFFSPISDFEFWPRSVRSPRPHTQRVYIALITRGPSPLHAFGHYRGQI